MKLVSFQFDTAEFFIGDFDIRFVMVFINCGFHDKTLAGLGASDQVNNGLHAHQWFTSPVLGNEAK